VIRSNARTILACERVILNLMQRMSGISTATRRYVDAVAGTKAKVLDTRKTAPGLPHSTSTQCVAAGAKAIALIFPTESGQEQPHRSGCGIPR